MKKKILLLLSVIILATTAITAPTVAQADTVETTTAEQPSYKVTTIKAKTMYTTKKCNVRKEPSAKSKSVGTLKKNQKVTVIGKTKVKGKLWYQIKTKKGNVKFVSASVLTTQKKDTSKQETKPSTNNDKDTAKSQAAADKIHQQMREEAKNDKEFMDSLLNSNISLE